MQVSIIIVNYNTKDLLRDCLKSIYEKTKSVLFEVIVSDNGSIDGSCEMIHAEFPDVILIDNNANLGFGAANNRALDVAKGEFVFYLNSDTVLLNDAVSIFYDEWKRLENAEETKNIGALGTNLFDANMNIAHSFVNFPTKLSVAKELFFMFVLNIFLSILYIFKIDAKNFRKLKSKNVVKTGKVDFVTGADLFMKNDCFAKFDEYFFLYYDDTDIQFQLRKKGKMSYLIDSPKIQHLEGGSVGEGYTIKRKGSFSRIQFEIARVKYFKKNYNSSLYVLFLKIMISIIWINPFLIRNTIKYFKQLWEI